MKQGRFSPDDQSNEAHPRRRGNFSCAHLWLEEVESVDALLAMLETLSQGDPEHRYLCTLDDVNQCSYTCGHAAQDDRLYLEEPDDEDEDGDWDDDPAQEAAWEQQSLQHRVQQLSNPSLVQTWEQVCGSLATSGEDVLALVQANQAPEQLLDDVIYLQRIPVSVDHLKIAAQPNGYFSADWDTFQNHAIIRHLAAQHGYRFFGMGASWMGFVRDAVPSAEQANQLVQDLQALYGKGNDEVLGHPAWAQFQAVLQFRKTLMLGYTENMGEGVSLPALDPSSECDVL